MPPMDRLEVAKGVEATRDFALFLRNERALVISDLHLGFEGALAEQGVSIPRFQRRVILERLGKMLDRGKAEKVIIAGDFKHEFSKNLVDEWVEVKQVLRFLKDRVTPILVRGNHDNYLATILGDLNLTLDPRADIGGYTIVHGHEEVSTLHPIIMGHEHPAVKLKDELGAVVSVPAFLVTDRLVVLPAFSPLALGVDVSSYPYLSPIRPIVDVAADLGLTRDDLVRKGDYIAKVRVAAVDRARKARQGKLVLVTGTTPTRYGEGKTLTTVGLGQALNRIGTKAIIAVREPSLGPVFGTKGGATGGGHSQVLPMEEINLHFTGDIHAVGAANNLIAAVMDAHLFHGNVLDLDPTRVLFPRCLDMNDRQLRNIVTGLGGPKHGVPREDGFIITAASEVMAILCLTEGIHDLKARLERIVVAFDRREHPARVGDLYVHGAAAILLKD